MAPGIRTNAHALRCHPITSHHRQDHADPAVPARGRLRQPGVHRRRLHAAPPGGGHQHRAARVGGDGRGARPGGRVHDPLRGRQRPAHDGPQVRHGRDAAARGHVGSAAAAVQRDRAGRRCVVPRAGSGTEKIVLSKVPAACVQTNSRIFLRFATKRTNGPCRRMY